MNDQSSSLIGDANFHPATPRQSVGLMETRTPFNRNLPAGEVQSEEGSIDRPSSEEDLLQFFLSIETTRQEMETYTHYLDTAMRQSTQARLEAEAAARLKSDFLVTMSHDMRIPLNGIIGMTAALLSRDLGALEREYVETIRQTGESLRGIVDDLLDLSTIEAGKLRLERVDFDLASLIGDALQTLQSASAHKPLTLVVKHDPRLPKWIRGDATRIRQILVNLIGNAIKFSDEGMIEIHTRVQFIDHEECELLVSVKDEGIGITDEQQHKMFQPFSQAEDSTRKYGGTGLGLAICKRLAELMGGQIGVTSRFGEGSLFWFTVRAQVVAEPPASDAVPMQVPASAKERKTARILLVEDNKVSEKVALLMLKNLGYAADVAHNGAEALLALDCANYDIILMDCTMPEMDGFETTRRLRNFGDHTSTVPVIAMTAGAFDHDRVACLTAGMNDFISKPVTESGLGEKLSFWLAMERAIPPAAG